jgi:hypothetical protein
VTGKGDTFELLQLGSYPASTDPFSFYGAGPLSLSDTSNGGVTSGDGILSYTSSGIDCQLGCSFLLLYSETAADLSTFGADAFVGLHIPEPATLTMFGLAVAGLARIRRRAV